MGGQDGYSRTMLAYSETANSILAGVKIHPAESWDLGLNFAYTAAKGGMAPFELPADDYVATHPPTAYDFTYTNTYSNIDVNRFNIDAMLKYKVTEDLWLRFWYKYVDFSDRDPYLYDTSGAVQWATVTAGWNF